MMHYGRDAGGTPALTTVTSGTITLDPPGVALHVQDIYG
jgi:hypothetical protein